MSRSNHKPQQAVDQSSLVTIIIAKPCSLPSMQNLSSLASSSSYGAHLFCPGEKLCPKITNGAVYGGGAPHSLAIYTSDSAVCAAARHSGIIDADGGVFCVETASGLAQYSGSTRNGISTRNWHDFPGSFAVYPSSALPPATQQGFIDFTLASHDDDARDANNNIISSTSTLTATTAAAITATTTTATATKEPTSMMTEEKVHLLTSYKSAEDYRKNTTGSALHGSSIMSCADYKKDSCSGKYFCPGASCVKRGSVTSAAPVWGIGPGGEQVATGDSSPCQFARFMNVIDANSGGWYELTPVPGFPRFIGSQGPHPVNQVTVRPWNQPYLKCFTVAKPIPSLNFAESEDDRKKEKRGVKEPAVVSYQEEKMTMVKGEEYF